MSWYENIVADIRRLVEPAEEILCHIGGMQGIYGIHRNKVVAVTQSRLIVADERQFKKKGFEAYSILDITNVDCQKGMMMSKLNLCISGDLIKFYGIMFGDVTMMTSVIQERMRALNEPVTNPGTPSEPPAVDPTPSSLPNETSQPVATIRAATSDDILDQIEKLSQLHQSGVLTGEEFHEKKQELLARL